VPSTNTGKPLEDFKPPRNPYDEKQPATGISPSTDPKGRVVSPAPTSEASGNTD
jgi:hypothetical protein